MTSARRARERRERRAAASASLARFVRRSCTACESPRLRWLTPAEALGVVEWEWLQTAAHDLGRVAEVWVCQDCGDHGAFGPANGEWLDALDDRMTGAQSARPPV